MNLCVIDGCDAEAYITGYDNVALCRPHYDALREWQRVVAAGVTEGLTDEPMTCPRRIEDRGPDGGRGPHDGLGIDRWQMTHNARGVMHRTCSYCGSLHPDDFMQAIHDGRKIGPTDKNYKAYVGKHDAKFYFQHLSARQRAEFIDLHNAETMNIGYPGHFYVRPFFTGVKPR